MSTSAEIALERARALYADIQTWPDTGIDQPGALDLLSGVIARLEAIRQDELELVGTRTERYDGGAGVWAVVLVHDSAAPGPGGFPSQISVGLFQAESDYPCFIWSHGRRDLRHIYVERLEVSPEGQAREQMLAGALARVLER